MHALLYYLRFKVMGITHVLKKRADKYWVSNWYGLPTQLPN